MNREFKDSGITYLKKIPLNWNIYRIKNGFKCNKEIVGDNWGSTQLLSLTTNGIKEKDIDNPNGKLPESFETYQYVKKNNIVMCLFDLDCSAVFSGISNYNGMISPAYKVLECNEKLIEPRYAGYYFNYIGFDRKYMHYSKNIRFTLNYDEFSSLPMLYPPIDEQKRIADYLDDKCYNIYKIIEDNKKIIDLIESYKLDNTINIVTKGLNNSKTKISSIAWIGSIPESWNEGQIKFFTTSRSGSTPDRNNSEYWTNGTIPWMSSGEVNKVEVYETNEKITELAIGDNKDKIIKKNSVMVALNGQGKTKGMSAILKIDAACNQSLCAFTCDEKNLHYRYLFYCFQCMYKYLRSQAGDDARDGLAAAFVRRQIIPFPPIDEQKRIADYLDDNWNKINKIIEYRKKIITKLEDYKKSLIYEVVTGKKEV